MKTTWFYTFVSIPMSLTLILNSVQPAVADSQSPVSGHKEHRYILVAKSDADYEQLRSDAVRGGTKVVKDIRHAKILVVSSADDVQTQLESNLHAQKVVPDRVVHLIKPQMAKEFGFNNSPERVRIDRGHGGYSKHINPDPAFSLSGLMWNVNRINAPKAWKTTTGDSTVLVGVADTGLDYTHSELAPKIADMVDFSDSLCHDDFGSSDADWATYFGVDPSLANTDWSGHGSWIGGNIAGALDGVGINGVAPNVKLVSLKISQWCGYAWDSSILDAFYYAADNGIDVVSISFGGYQDRTDPDQDAIYNAYVDAVAYARSKGTVIVASAGNEHIRIGDGGQVISHGSFGLPGDPVVDYYGLWQTPGGIPGVVMVSATGNVVNASSKNCDTGTFESNDATCKPKSDPHQPIGVGKQNQLTYYSNYGPRIDVAAPGGARKFNLPGVDRGGTGGFPYVETEGYKAWEDFSITSNWALDVPCFINIGTEFYPNECYSNIQGTSMATPHVSAVLALIASSNKSARYHPDTLVRILKQSAQNVYGNTTPPVSATDLSPADRTGIICTFGYCHLGGKPISDKDAYGAGLIDASRAVAKRE